MKVSTLLVLSASTLAICQSPSSWKGDGKRNGADFVLVDQGVNTHLGPLSKMFANANKQANVAKVFDDGNHQMSGATTQLSWEKTKDLNDVDTKKWYPQGISSTADAAEVGTYDGRIYVSRSNGANTNGDIWGWIPGNGAAINKGMVPPGPEDLSYDKRGRTLYTVIEHPGKRYLVTLDSNRIKFT